jgi:hypothetical protein
MIGFTRPIRALCAVSPLPPYRVLLDMLLLWDCCDSLRRGYMVAASSMMAPHYLGPRAPFLAQCTGEPVQVGFKPHAEQCLLFFPPPRRSFVALPLALLSICPAGIPQIVAFLKQAVALHFWQYLSTQQSVGHCGGLKFGYGMHIKIQVSVESAVLSFTPVNCHCHISQPLAPASRQGEAAASCRACIGGCGCLRSRDFIGHSMAESSSQSGRSTYAEEFGARLHCHTERGLVGLCHRLGRSPRHSDRSGRWLQGAMAMPVSGMPWGAPGPRGTLAVSGMPWGWGSGLP